MNERHRILETLSASEWMILESMGVQLGDCKKERARREVEKTLKKQSDAAVAKGDQRRAVIKAIRWSYVMFQRTKWSQR